MAIALRAVALGVAAASVAAAAPAQWLALIQPGTNPSKLELVELSAQGTVSKRLTGPLPAVTANEAAVQGTLRCGVGYCFFATLDTSSMASYLYNVTLEGNSTLRLPVSSALLAGIELDPATAGGALTVVSGGGTKRVDAVSPSGTVRQLVSFSNASGFVVDGGTALCSSSSSPSWTPAASSGASTAAAAQRDISDAAVDGLYIAIGSSATEDFVVRYDPSTGDFLPWYRYLGVVPAAMAPDCGNGRVLGTAQDANTDALQLVQLGATSLSVLYESGSTLSSPSLGSVLGYDPSSQQAIAAVLDGQQVPYVWTVNLAAHTSDVARTSFMLVGAVPLPA